MPSIISHSPFPSRSSIFIRDPPAERLGIDVLQLIFEACGEGNRTKEEAEHIPFTLASVSRRWRMVALKTSRIWTTIFFQGFVTSTRIFRRAFICLRYSRLLPLVVHVDMRREEYEPLLPPEEEDPDIYSVVRNRMEWMEELLRHHTWRIRELSFISDTYKPIDVFLRCLESSRFISLESIDIRRANPLYVKMDEFEPSSLILFKQPSSICDFGRAARVRSLDLLGVHVHWEKVMVHKLTRLTLGYLADEVKPSLEQLYGLLLASRQTLEYLDLQGILEAEYHSLGIHEYEAQVEEQDVASDDQRSTGAGTASNTAEDRRQRAWNNMVNGWVEEGPTDFWPGDFPNLRELRVGFLGPHEGVVVLSLIRAPNLRHLTLTDIQYTLWPIDEQPWGRSTHRCHDMLVYIGRRHIFDPDALPLGLLESLRFEGIYPSPNVATLFLTDCDRLRSLSVINSAKVLVNSGLERNSFSGLEKPSAVLESLHVHIRSVCPVSSAIYIFKTEMEQARRDFVPLETLAVEYDCFPEWRDCKECYSLPHVLDEQIARDMFEGYNVAKQVVIRRVPLKEGGPPICPHHEEMLGWKSEVAL